MPFPLDVVIVQISSVNLHLLLSLLPVFADVHQKDILFLIETLIPSENALEFAFHVKVSTVGNARIQHGVDLMLDS